MKEVKFFVVVLIVIFLGAGLAQASFEESSDRNLVRGSLNLDDDLVIFDGNENVTFSPNGGTLEIESSSNSPAINFIGQVQISGGNPGAGKVLTSDANGLASWEAPSGGGGSGDFNNGGDASTAARTLGNNNAHDLNFETADLTRVTIAANGNVGVGTTNPAQTFDVRGPARFGTEGTLINDRPNGNFGGQQAYLTVADGLGDSNAEIWIGPNTGDTKGHVQLVAEQVHVTAELLLSEELRFTRSGVTISQNSLGSLIVSGNNKVEFRARNGVDIDSGFLQVNRSGVRFADPDIGIQNVAAVGDCHVIESEGFGTRIAQCPNRYIATGGGVECSIKDEPIVLSRPAEFLFTGSPRKNRATAWHGECQSGISKAFAVCCTSFREF